MSNESFPSVPADPMTPRPGALKGGTEELAGKDPRWTPRPALDSRHAGSTRPVDVGAVRRAVDDHDALILQDLVDDAEVTAAGRVKALELSAQRLSNPMRVDRD